MPSTVHVGPADHEVDVDRRTRSTRSRSASSLDGERVGRGRARCGWRRSRRAACRRRRCPARRSGPRRRPARPRRGGGALVAAAWRAQRLRAARRRRCRPRGRPRSAPSARATTVPPSTSGLVARTSPSTRVGSGVVKTSSVGRFGMCSMPSTVEKRAAIQRELGQQADGQVGARALVVQRVEAARGEPLGHGDELVRARAPGGDRVLLVEPADVHDLLPELGQRRRRARGRGARASAQAGGRAGPIVQLIVRSLTTSPASFTRGSRSRPARAGRGRRAGPGATGAGRGRCARARWRPSARIRSPYQAARSRACPRRRARSARA